MDTSVLESRDLKVLGRRYNRKTKRFLYLCERLSTGEQKWRTLKQMPRECRYTVMMSEMPQFSDDEGEGRGSPEASNTSDDGSESVSRSTRRGSASVGRSVMKSARRLEVQRLSPIPSSGKGAADASRPQASPLEVLAAISQQQLRPNTPLAAIPMRPLVPDANPSVPSPVVPSGAARPISTPGNNNDLTESTIDEDAEDGVLTPFGQALHLVLFLLLLIAVVFKAMGYVFLVVKAPV